MNFNKTLIALFLFMLIIIISFSDFYFFDKDLKQDVIRFSLENCNAQKQACNVELGEINIKIFFDDNIYYLKPFNISVWTENKKEENIESVEIEFKMKNMNMGFNRFQLTSIPSENNKMRWQGTALLPICVAGRADWFSELEVVANGKKYILTIPLVVKRSSH